MEGQAAGLGQRLAERCQRNGLSLQKAAAKAGLSHATIQAIINGSSASGQTIRKLAAAEAAKSLSQKGGERFRKVERKSGSLTELLI